MKKTEKKKKKRNEAMRLHEVIPNNDNEFFNDPDNRRCIRLAHAAQLRLVFYCVYANSLH